MEKKTRPHIRSFQLCSKDRLLLCSDGLPDMLPEKTITEILLQNESPNHAAQILVDQANNAGGHDNITAIVIDWLGKPV